MVSGWTKFKDLLDVVTSSIVRKQTDALFILEKTLKKHKADFVCLLKNPPRNSSHRIQVQSAYKQGLKISTDSNPLILPQEFIDESLILSDILDLNEISAVELLLAGEQLLFNFPSLTRGLVAVLLYYDGKKSIATSLRTIIQARDGVSWTLNLPRGITEMITKFTDDLFQDGLVDEILKQVGNFCLQKELENLSKGQAIKDNQHRQQITDIIEDTNHALMDCLVYWSCQTPFDKDTLLKFVSTLKNFSGMDEGFHPIEYKTLALLFSLVTSFSVTGPLSDPIAMDGVLGEDTIFPVFSDRTFIPMLHKLIVNDWENVALAAVVQLAWGVFLRECWSFDALNEIDELRYDEDIVDVAIDGDVFQFIREAVISSPYFFHEEYYVRRLHHIFTSFVVLMPNKIAELRNQADADSLAREMLVDITKGNTFPQKIRQDFGELMKMVGDLYYNDPLGLCLSLEYWAPIDGDTKSGTGLQIPHRQLSLLKFVHQCSDLLPPLLFTSFMCMLLGLSNCKEGATHCFNFLKSNSDSLGGGGPSASFSLDHFFNSLKQYYFGLRQNVRMNQTATGCAISPQEIEGLVCVLKLIRTIAKYDESCRQVMYENELWLPVASMFGLLGCGIPRTLKSELFLTLAEFAGTTEIAASMWQTLENSQVLNTVSNVSAGSNGQYCVGISSQEGSIHIELEEIEAQEENYVQTRAFLYLLNSLTGVMPSMLGLRHRVPGFNPYLEFVCDSVFLKFDTRGYKDPQEKWLVANAAMEIILKVLSNYEINTEDYEERTYEISPGKMVSLPPHPGQILLQHLHNDSAVLRKVLCILDECCSSMLDVDSATDAIANAALSALRIIEIALRKQETFFAVLRDTSYHSITATPLNQLLLGINPRSRLADYYSIILKYVCIPNCSPELPLMAVKILRFACQTAAVSRDMLYSLFVHDSCSSLLRGFVDHLEWQDPSQLKPAMLGNELTEMEQSEDVRQQLKEEIVSLLIDCIKCPIPNIGLLLLGFISPPFDKRRLKEVPLQDPGVLGSFKTCLHCVLDIVAVGKSRNSPCGCHIKYPQLTELCYHLLYLVCAHKDLTDNIMRYLRNNYDFFKVQLVNIPFPWLQELSKPSFIFAMKQQAWILRLIAVELRLSIMKNNQSYALQLVSVLLRPSTNQFHECDKFNQIDPVWSIAANSDFNVVNDDSADSGRWKLLNILDFISFQINPHPNFQLQFFVSELVENVISRCLNSFKGTAPYIDIKRLHSLLLAELNFIQGAAVISQKQFILEEIASILKVAVDRNYLMEVMHCHLQCMEAWCNVINVMVGVVNDNKDQNDMKVPILFEIVQNLLLKVDAIDTNVFSALAHSVVFTLLAHLRQMLSNEMKPLDDCHSFKSGPMQSTFRSLLDSLVKCPVGMQQLRTHLYSSLLSYLHMTKENHREKVGLYTEEENGLSVANAVILGEYGEYLVDMVCGDACNGHDVAKMLSLSLLDSIVNLDKQQNWLKYMTARGYLQKICSSFIWDDELLQTMLNPQMSGLRPLYIYESKMAFLCTVASTSVGSHDLVALNCLANFNTCKFIDHRPGSQGNTNSTLPNTSSKSFSVSTEFIPSVSNRYRQLLLPVLRFLLVLLTTPGSHTMDAADQIMMFINCHIDIFISILKDVNSFASIGRLQELSLVTAIISHCNAGSQTIFDSDVLSLKQVFLLQSQLFSLLPHFVAPLNWKHIAKEVSKQEEDSGLQSLDSFWEESYGLCQQICSNLMLFCERIMISTGSDFSANTGKIFCSPDVSMAISPISDVYSLISDLPSLGLLICSLKGVTEEYFILYEMVERQQNNVVKIQNMNSEEVKELLPGIFKPNTLTLVQMRNICQCILQHRLDGKRKQLSICLYILEHMLYILWRHLQFYLVFCQPTEIDDNFFGQSRKGNRTIHGASNNQSLSEYKNEQVDLSHMADGISKNDLEQLKLNIVKCLTDNFLKKLQNINEMNTTSSVRFIHAVTRRIKKLLKFKAANKTVIQL